MKVMVTGDRGYIGAILVPMLIENDHEVIGFDVGYFTNNLLEDYSDEYEKITKDLRDIDKDHLSGVDAIIHLAALNEIQRADYVVLVILAGIANRFWNHDVSGKVNNGVELPGLHQPLHRLAVPRV